MTEEEETVVHDPLLEPFTDLEKRKIPIQDDKMRGWILSVYLVFLLIGVPIWWHCTSVPSRIAIPSDFEPKHMPVINVHFDDYKEELDWKEYSLVMGKFYFNIVNRGKADLKDELNDSMNLNIFLTKKESDIIKRGKRTLIVPAKSSSKTAISNILNEILDSFKVPKLKKSEIKLKFTTLLSEKGEYNAFSNIPNLLNFILHLSPVLKVKSVFQTKFVEEISELSAEMFIGSKPIAKIDSRDERGRSDVFNFVSLSQRKSENLFIPNWGLIISGALDEKILISGLRRLLGFPSHQILPEIVEIEFWREKVNQFYEEKCSEMLKLLSPNSPPLKVTSPKEAFDTFEKLVHDPKLLAAAYFPDDHKFAVYLPVYLPLILPIFVALVAFIKEIKAKRRALKVKDE